MQNNTFTEKLYTSTEVAEILGVSLRSIYRYLDENKIQAAVKTATGRHRFTRQNINDFLHPGSNTTSERPTDRAREAVSRKEEEHYTAPVEVKKTATAAKEQPKAAIEEETVKDEPIDWLARFRQAAEKYKTQEKSTTIETTETRVDLDNDEYEITTKTVEEEFSEPENVQKFYRSGVGGLKEIAQSLDKAAKNASLNYAFTMNAGLSLHKPIKPFSIIHAYVRPGDLGYFEKVLQLTPSERDTAQLCLILSDEQELYSQKREMHGLYVVSDKRIKLDLLNEGETDLANELE